jgi:hypothetical protein
VLSDYRDGFALGLRVDAQDALTAAVTLRDRLLADLQRGVFPAMIGVGISVGPDAPSRDANGRLLVAGEVLGDAERAMAAANPGQILVSRAFHDAIANATPDLSAALRYAVTINDPHGRECRLYAVSALGQAADTVLLPDPPRTHAPNTQMISDSTGWERAELTAAAIALEPYVGARARELVKQAAERAASVADLYRLLADAIPQPAARAEFCQTQGIAPPSTGAARADHTSATDLAPAARTPPAVLDPAIVQAAEQELALLVGPLAHLLVKQHAQGQPATETFLARLADELVEAHRARFLDAMRKRFGAP